jgi:hypothetical protein
LVVPEIGGRVEVDRLLRKFRRAISSLPRLCTFVPSKDEGVRGRETYLVLPSSLGGTNVQS